VKIPVTEQIVKYSDLGAPNTSVWSSDLGAPNTSVWSSGDCLDQDHAPKCIEATAM